MLATDENMYLRVTAGYTDGHGSGKSERATTDTPVSVNAPENLVAVPGNARVALSWDDPGDADIVRYQYRYRSTADSSWNPGWADIAASSATTTSYTASGLVNGLEYTFEVRRMYLTNGLDDPGGPGTVISVPRGVLAAPAGLTGVGGDQHVTLSWQDPADASVSGYQYRYRATSASAWAPDWTDIAAGNATTTSHLVIGLTNLTEYAFEVRAVRAGSPGPATAVDARPEGPPDPALRTSHLYAYWTASTDSTEPHPQSNENRLETVPCSGTHSFRVIWSLPDGPRRRRRLAGADQPPVRRIRHPARLPHAQARHTRDDRHRQPRRRVAAAVDSGAGPLRRHLGHMVSLRAAPLRQSRRTLRH